MKEWFNNLFSTEMLDNVSEMIVSFPLPNIPKIRRGDNLGALVAEKMRLVGGVKDQDIFVIASKIVSKSEGQVVDLTAVDPTEEAQQLYKRLGRKSPQLIQLILDHSQSYTVQNGIILSKHKLGFIITSAGVDGLDDETAIILPEDPDESAATIRQEIENDTQKHVAVVISDSEGRPDRKGAGAISIGVSGIDPLRVNEARLGEGKLKRTEETISDLLAAQASLIMGQRGKNIPIVCIRGFHYRQNNEANIKSILHH